MFALGWLSLAFAFHRVPILPGRQNWVAIVALAMIPIVLFIPQTSGTYVYGIAALVVNWLVGHRIIAQTSAASTATDPTPEPA